MLRQGGVRSGIRADGIRRYGRGDGRRKSRCRRWGGDSTLSVLTTYTPVKDLALLERISVPLPAAEARIDIANISDQMNWMHESGYVADVPAIDRVVDTRFVSGAAQSTGANQ